MTDLFIVGDRVRYDSVDGGLGTRRQQGKGAELSREELAMVFMVIDSLVPDEEQG